MVSKESIKYSLKNIVHRKTRSFLTILSIFIGIAAIFIFISFGWGLYDYMNDFATGGSADKLTIMPKGIAAPGMDDTFAMTDDDLDAIEGASGVHKVTGLYIKTAEVKQNDDLRFTFIIGYNPEEPMIFDISNIGVHEGRMLRKGENNKVVLGYNYLIADRFFPRAYEINDVIEIQGEDFRIVGFVEEIGNPSDDSQIYLSNEDMPDLYPNVTLKYGWAIAQVDPKRMEVVIENVEKALRKERDLEEGKEDFFVQSWQDLLETYGNATLFVSLFVFLIAAISVLVSAINTSNTMITSVYERYKEIGIMKAVGAKNNEIFNIFLFESGFLGLIAGILGVGFGWLITYIAKVILDNMGWGFLSPHYSGYLFAGAIAFATLTGAISGAVPAYQASKTNPVDALRYE